MSVICNSPILVRSKILPRTTVVRRPVKSSMKYLLCLLTLSLFNRRWEICVCRLPLREKLSFTRTKLLRAIASHSLHMMPARNSFYQQITPTHFCKQLALWMTRGEFDLACKGSFLRSMSFSNCLSIQANLNVLIQHLFASSTAAVDLLIWHLLRTTT